ncbi:uncharacterized protein LOC112050483 [Bicyclus anynana]|uniref:Uncharacterized protein LOC112050483 n=1 Tax=Bicyclus anynana TaxID=110368 RepID=A0A6J1NC84_BICAN|nr:uncharacterized protein LOC112050483 [Bicyclus anynana]
MTLTIVTFNNSIQMFYILSFLQFVVDMYFIYLYRKDYMEYYSLYDYIDRVLGMPNYAQIKKSNNKICFFFIFLAATTILIDYTAWRIAYGWVLTTIYSIDYLYLALRIVSSLEIMTHFSQVLFRLKIVGDSIEVFHSSNNLKLGGFLAAQKKDRLDKLKIICYNHSDVILWYKRCYLLLLEQCDFINNAYGFRRTPHGSGSLPMLSTVMRIINSLCVLLIGISRCEQNYRETERIVSLIDDLIINKKTDEASSSSLLELRHLISTRPVQFKAMNFYRLDYSCFVSVISAIVTYTIILLQSLT